MPVQTSPTSPTTKLLPSRRTDPRSPTASTTAHIVRRIVLYGRPSSGKTCFLAAMAMARLPHPDGYSCVWVRDTQSVPMPDGHRDTWDPHDPRVALYLGVDWLERAIDYIERGEVPPATPNDVTPYRLLFDLTIPDGRIIRLEMIDYSGELVDPNLAEDDLAKQLIDHLEEADGVLVLAEAPPKAVDQDGADMQAVGQHRELQVLQQALILVAEKRRKGRSEPIPVGLLLNKWDRYTAMETYDKTASQIEKDIFMSRTPPVPQRVLLNVLTAVAGRIGDELFSEAFPVSAFGKTHSVVVRNPDGTERRLEVPVKLTPLQSYGLEDPLIWVCEKSSSLEMREFQAEVSGMAPWKIWQAATGRPLAVRARMQALRKKIPSHVPQAAVIDELVGRSLTAFTRQCAFGVLTALVLFGGLLEFGVYHYDNWRYTEAYPALEAAKVGASPVDWAPQWRDAGEFLASYSKPSLLRIASHWWLLSRESAERQLSELQPKLLEAERIIAVRTEFDAAVGRIVGQALATEDLSTVDALEKELKMLLVPDEYPGGGAKMQEGLAGLAERAETLRVTKFGEDLRQEYHNLVSARRLAEAAEMLSSKDRQSPEVVSTLKSDFQNRWDTVLISELQSLCERGEWTQALRAIDEFENSREAVVLAGANGRIRRDEMRRRVESHRIEKVYADWFSDRQNLTKYNRLEQYGSAEDRDRALAWKEFDDFSRQEHRWQITMEEIYQPNYGGEFGVDTRTSCRRDGSVICEATWNFDRKPETARPNRSGTTYAKYEELMTLSLRYETLNFVFGNTDGTASWTGTPRELLDGVTIRIVTGAYGDADVTLRSSLASGTIPPMPDLRQPVGGSF